MIETTGGADLQAAPNRSPSKMEDKEKADLWRRAGTKVGVEGGGWGGVGGGRCRGPSLSEGDCEEPSLITTCFKAFFSQGCFRGCVTAQMTRKYKLSKSS